MYVTLSCCTLSRARRSASRSEAAPPSSRERRQPAPSQAAGCRARDGREEVSIDRPCWCLQPWLADARSQSQKHGPCSTLRSSAVQRLAAAAGSGCSARVRRVHGTPHAGTRTAETRSSPSSRSRTNFRLEEIGAATLHSMAPDPWGITRSVWLRSMIAEQSRQAGKGLRSLQFPLLPMNCPCQTLGGDGVLLASRCSIWTQP
jgi:hypothetical protein